MERKLLTRVGQAIYKLRSSTIESVFGQMSMRGLARFWLRGLDKVKGEWVLWCSTHNLLKLRHAGFRPTRGQSWHADKGDMQIALTVGARFAPMLRHPVAR